MNDKEYLGEGHYRDQDGNEFMSIWTFKRAFEVGNNNNQQNYEDAKALAGVKKFWGPFNKSQYFKEGWMFEINGLKSFYNI